MHKKTYLIFLLLLTVPLHARRFSTNFGIDFNYARFKLDNVAPQSGYLAGPHFDFSYKKPWSVYTGVNFDGRWNAGLICSCNDLCNTGCLEGGNAQADVNDYFADWQLGYYFDNDEKTLNAVPFIGVGFQHLSYQLEPNVMRYKYRQIYVPVGLEMLYNSPRDFSIGFKAVYRAGVYNRLRVSTPCVEDDCDSPCSDQIKLRYSHGAYFEVPAVLHYRQDKDVGFHITLAPFFDWNRFADTCDCNSNGVVFPIPVNKRWYVGMNMNLGVTF